MVKKAYSYDILSETKKCVKCGKRLKKRIETEHPRFNKCWRCYKGISMRRDK